MSRSATVKSRAYLQKFTPRKVQAVLGGLPADLPDSLTAWVTRWLTLAVVGVRSDEVTRKISPHLYRFAGFCQECYGHHRISTRLRRDTLAS